MHLSLPNFQLYCWSAHSHNILFWFGSVDLPWCKLELLLSTRCWWTWWPVQVTRLTCWFLQTAGGKEKKNPASTASRAAAGFPEKLCSRALLIPAGGQRVRGRRRPSCRGTETLTSPSHGVYGDFGCRAGVDVPVETANYWTGLIKAMSDHLWSDDVIS